MIPEIQPAIDPQTSGSSLRSKVFNLSVWQFGLSLLTSLALFVIAIRYSLGGLEIASEPVYSSQNVVGAFLTAASIALCAILLLPSVYYALARLAGHPVRARLDPRWKIGPVVTFLMLGLLFGILLLCGSVLVKSHLSWSILPFVHILAVGLPVLTVVYLGVRGLPTGSPQRAWGIFGSGLVIGPGLIIVAEVVVMFVAGIVGVLFLAGQPGGLQELNDVVQQLQVDGQGVDVILPTLKPYLQQPVVILALLSFFSGIVPLIEEALKPIGVWLLWRRNLTPVEGFAAGMLSGAGFALVESLGYTSGSTSGWVSTVLIRSTTAVMHIFAAGLTGWGLASACSEKRYLRLLGGYGAAVFIHGLWNGLTLLMGILLILGIDHPSYLLWGGLAAISMILLFGVVCLFFLLVSHRLRRAIMPTAPSLDSVSEEGVP
jgi:RsiW-degrading membrane proteinase PrsW (M82 family)